MRLPPGAAPKQWSAGRAGGARLSAGALSSWAGGAALVLRCCIRTKVCRQGTRKVICRQGSTRAKPGATDGLQASLIPAAGGV